jgi:hypothetical protein
MEPLPASFGEIDARSSWKPSPASPWRLVLLVGLPYWVAVSITNIVSFELFVAGGPRRFNPAVLGLTPGVRALQHTIMLVVVIVAYRAALRIGWPRERRGLAAAQHLGVALLAALMARPVLALSSHLVMGVNVDWLHVFLPPPRGAKLWASMTMEFLIVYLFGLVLILGVQIAGALERSELERANLRNAWAQARLQALRMQLNPHFAFNTFNTIATLLDGDPQPARARTLVLALSDLYRRTLVASEREWMPIEDELALARDYLRIQAARMEGRLTYDLECPSQLAGEQIPALILQPLVENAVQHGVDDDRHALHIWVTVGPIASPEAEHRIRIQVGNSTAASLGSTPGAGVGLRNAQLRLAACFQGRAALEARSDAPGRFTVDLSLPLYRDHSSGQELERRGI